MNKAEITLIKRISSRLIMLEGTYFYEREACLTDLEAVHNNGCPLDFEKLLYADIVDFKRDIYGIRRNLDRRTGKLVDFVPLCAIIPPKLSIRSIAGVVLFRNEHGIVYYTNEQGQGLRCRGIQVIAPKDFSVAGQSRGTIRRRFLKLGL